MSPLNINLSKKEYQSLSPKILVFGVGGAGGNAINNMIRSDLQGVKFIAANTDAQALLLADAEHKIQLGLNATKGLGAGSYPEVGKNAAEEAYEEIEALLEGAHMIFITAGMGGGTGTGAAPVIAKMAKERDILTTAVITKPFDFEGKYRMKIADEGIAELRKYVDTLIIVPNQNLFRVANVNTTVETAFQIADDVLHAGVRGITDLITMPGLINLDFADVKTVMKKMGKAMMGTGEAEGENRAIRAVEEAISNPLLDEVSIRGAKGVIVNITGSPDITLFEFDEAAKRIKEEIDGDANIIIGTAFNKDLKGIRVSVFATGIDNDNLGDYDLYNSQTEEPKIEEELDIFGGSTNQSQFEDSKENPFQSKNTNESIKNKSFNNNSNNDEFFDTGVSVKITEFDEQENPRNNEYRLRNKPMLRQKKEKKSRGLFGLFGGGKKNKNNITLDMSENNGEIEINDDIMNIPSYLRKNRE